ncbi:MAG: HAMP domain-containing histidine kinase [Acidimicrobiia bacterium]|nr:HAMP domain-containing histidine kinase [Acidimicrobiia bacterium]
MPRPHGHGEDWWADRKGEFWAKPGSGAQTWQGFGRAMLFGALFFFMFVTAVVLGFAWVVTSLFSAGGVFKFIATILLVPVALVVLGILVVSVGSRTWRPVSDMVRAAGSLADGDYSARARPARARAMRPVVASFNDMARRLETAEEQRRRLLADLGHELRTPLTVIRGEIEAIRDGIHEPSAETLALLVSEVDVMERLLEDLRTLSLIEAGSLALHPEPTNIEELLNEVAEGQRIRADEAGVIVRVDAAPVEMVIDPVRIREVVSNLVVNSLSAMPDGGAVRITARPSGAGVVIEVADTGFGIPDDELEAVFDRFHKGEASPGTGLGLTISRDLVAAHGGTLTIESTAGRGTTVRVDLSQVTPSTGAPLG